MNDFRKLFWAQVPYLTLANMKSRYRKTFAGFIWVVMNPILLYGAQSLAFKTFLRLELPNFFTYLLAGLLPWIFIIQTADMATPLLVTNGHFLKAMKVHPLVLLLSQVLDNFINFSFAFIILLIPVCFADGVSWHGLFFLPIGLFILISGVIGMSWLLAILNIFYRDVRYVVSFLTGVMFFLTPIFYPVSYIPEKYRWMVSINPFYNLIQPVRSTLYQFDLENMLKAFGIGLGWSGGLLLLGALYWKKKKNVIYYHI
ncbi:MAG: ABC transporter permease [Bacteriovoracales bacterium]|nr:ABC transporter permease [Bacteriovoracales bacterium]